MDDAVLSCGGLMDQFSKKIPMVIVTFATKDPGKINRNESQFLTEVDLAPPKQRILEEKRALSSLGISLKSLGFIDGVYRRGTNKKLLYPKQLFGYKSVPKRDADTLARLVQILRKKIRKSDLLLYPLGIGGHVDHVLCKLAAKKLKGIKKLGYEDFPYLALHKVPVPKRAIKLNYSLKNKVKLIKFYKSQIKMLFKNSENIPRMLLQRTKSATEFYVK